MRLTEHADVSSDATCKEAFPQTGREGLLFFYFSFCSVARWGATFCSFRGIGEGGTASPRGSWSRGGGPCCPWTPLGGIIIPPAARRAAPPRKGRVPLRVAGFATLRWCEQLAFLSPEAPSRKHRLLLNRGAGMTGDECVSCVGFVSSLCQGIWLC